MRLSNPKWELFAQHRAAGESMSESARRAGFLTGPGNQGSRMAKYPQIVARIAELKSINPATGEKQSEAATIPLEVLHTSKPWVVNELVSVHKGAASRAQFNVSVQALRTLAQIGGFLEPPAGPRKLEQHLHIPAMTPAQLNEALRQNFGNLKPEERKALALDSPDLSDIVDAELTEEQSTAA